MTPPPPTNTAHVPTMRVAVELGYVRACVECRSIAERTAIAAIHDPSVTAFRAVPGSKHAHPTEPATPEPTPIDHPTEALLFEHTPHSDTNGFDPEGRK